MNTAIIKSIAGTYLRASVAAVLALYLSGVSDPKLLLNAALAGLVGPLAKALNPKCLDYGFKVK